MKTCKIEISYEYTSQRKKNSTVYKSKDLTDSNQFSIFFSKFVSMCSLNLKRPISKLLNIGLSNHSFLMSMW